MQPTFPPGHHFHHYRRQPALEVEQLRLVAALVRQCLPALDPSDPRDTADARSSRSRTSP